MNTLKPVETQMKRCLQRFCIYHEQLVCALTELVKERIQLEKKVDWNRTGSGNPYRITKRHFKSSTFPFILDHQVNQVKWPHLLCGVVTGKRATPARVTFGGKSTTKHSTRSSRPRSILISADKRVARGVVLVFHRSFLCF